MMLKRIWDVIVLVNYYWTHKVMYWRMTVDIHRPKTPVIVKAELIVRGILFSDCCYGIDTVHHHSENFDLLLRFPS